jgi:hypothetical protein
VVRYLLAPASVYLVLFCALTYPLIASFSTRFFTNSGDGLQNVWNLWWTNRALTVLHTSPWFTPYLHYPSGVSLIGHTLNPFNGLLAVALLPFMTLIQAHNVIVVLSFVMGGVGAFWLCHTVCRQYWPSVTGGAVFTFSQYHFAHAEGHLQLVSLEWLPVFALLWHRLLGRPSRTLAAGAALSLLLVILCDYYYFAYCVLYAMIVAGYEAWRRRDALFLIRRSHRASSLLFVLLGAVTSGQLIVRLLVLNATDPLLGSHQADQFSTDLLGAVVPGGHWRFADLTRPFWEALPGNIHESSVDIGLSVVGLLVFLIARRSERLVRQTGPWWLILIGFWALSLGPVLRIWGAPLLALPMPYRVLQKLAPALALSGVPSRMMVMVTLAAAVLVSVALALLWCGSVRARLVAVVVVVLLGVEYLPRPFPTSSPSVPGYVAALRALPEPGGVLDLVSGYSSDRPFGSDTGAGIALYYQTLHEHPMASGYIARLPSSAWQQLVDIKHLVDQGAYGVLCREYGLRFVVIATDDAATPALASATLLTADTEADAELIDLAPDGACRVGG